MAAGNHNRSTASASNVVFWIVAGGAVAFLLGRQVWWAVAGTFNVDEFENLQVVWLATKGWLPNRDFLHTHLPIYNLLLYPIYRAFGPVTDLPGIVRLFLLPVVGLTVFQIAWLARRASGSAKAGAAAVVFFLSPPVLASCFADARPDTLGWPLALGALMCAVGGLDSPAIGRRRFYGSAALMGASLLFSHKAIFFVPVLAWVFERRFVAIGRTPLPARIGRLALWGALVALPAFLVVVAWIGFLDLDETGRSMLLGAGVFEILPDGAALFKKMLYRAILPQLIVVLALAVWQAGTAWWSPARPTTPERVVSWTLAILTAVYAAQIAVQHVMFPQLYILPAITAAILAALRVSRLEPRVAATVVAAAFVLPLVVSTPGFDPYRTRGEQLERFAFVQRHVPPNKPVLDTYTGFGTFRPLPESLAALYMRPAWYGSIREYDAVVREVGERGVGAVCLEPSDPVFHYPSLAGALAGNYVESDRFPGLFILTAPPSDGREPTGTEAGR